MECILNTLLFDGLINVSNIEGEKMYSLNTTGLQFNGLTATPCGKSMIMTVPYVAGICPVAHLCGKTKEVQPSTCVYMSQWLEF